jgi:transposase-like protein
MKTSTARTIQTGEGHGEKLSRKAQAAIVALLAHPTIPEAAKACGVSETTSVGTARIGGRTMTEETQPTATTKKQAPRKKAGRKPGQKPYSQKQRGVALTIVDRFDGNVARAAQATGIERKTLFKWRQKWRQELELEAVETQEALMDDSLSLVAKLTRMTEALCVIALTKAQTATIGEIRQLLDVILSQIEKLSKADRIEAARAQLHPAVATPEPKVLPPSVDVVQKARWESMVNQVMQVAESEGKPMTRETAIAAIVKVKPEARQYLMPESELDQGYVN